MYTTMYIDFVPNIPTLPTDFTPDWPKSVPNEMCISSGKRVFFSLFQYWNGVFGVFCRFSNYFSNLVSI